MDTFRLYDFAMSAVEKEFYSRKLILSMATFFIDAQHLDTELCHLPESIVLFSVRIP